MAIGQSVFSAGAATGNPALMGVGAGISFLGGLLNLGQQNRAADFQEQSADVAGQIAGVQNQIYAEQYQTQRNNLMLRRREMFRQQQARTAGATVAAQASGSFRSSGFGAVQNQIAERTQENVGRIDRALESGERLSGLNQRVSTLQARQAELQAKAQRASSRGSIFSSLF